jgi:DNA invertase Pin-like site-specific DNA recombinase
MSHHSSPRYSPKPMAKHRKSVEAVAYLRTSSATNVGGGKDSEKRQRAAVERFARRNGYAIVDWFYDAAVSGADDIKVRPGFAALLDRIEANGIRVIIEDASRFARKLLTQELGIIALAERGVRVMTANGDDLTNTDDEMKVAMRQIAGAFAQLEKARLVRKLREARERKKAETGKCEGRKSLAESRPEVVALAKELRAQGVSLRGISAALAQRGYLTAGGKPYVISAVQTMLG